MFIIEYPRHVADISASFDTKQRWHSHYVPYLAKIENLGSSTYDLIHQGGIVRANLKKTESILFLGPSGDIPTAFLSDAADCGVAIIIHRTHGKNAYGFSPLARPDRDDVLSAQVRARDDGRLKLYIARVLVKARANGMAWRLNLPDAHLEKIRGAKKLASLRQSEAVAAGMYWSGYFHALNLPEVDRRSDHPVTAALDALSFFMSGIVHRWVLSHGLSTWHGFLHEPTNYTSLVFDLMEPYRGYAERAVFECYRDGGEDNLTARSIAMFKALMGEKIYVPATQQTVYRKTLLQGGVMALKAFLLKRSMRFVVPVEGILTAGKPQKNGYVLPGAIR